MQISNTYLEKLLVAVECCEKPHVTVYDWIASGVKVYFDSNEKNECRLEPEFLFHFLVLVEEELVISQDMTPFKTTDELGILFDDLGDGYDIDLKDKKLRLTSKGHERLKSLKSGEVRDNFVSEIKKSPATVVSTGIKTAFKIWIKGSP
ncbi:hypothetical protein RII69_003969 [Vibrio parahaemolyticus]|nr:hypothetical protein [Vibrio parahaemolyticus]ELC0687687.1 hypothetical protein [Vibrio parahaemolyticus]